MDRIAKVVTKRGLSEPDTSWVEYWRTRPVEERLAMATELSWELVDGHPEQGLRRIHRVVRVLEGLRSDDGIEEPDNDHADAHGDAG